MNERVGLYSASLYDAAKEENCLEEVYESLMAVCEIVKENKDYVNLLSSASLKSEERVALVEEAFGKEVNLFVVNFMKILAKRRIFEIFVPCAEKFQKRYFKDNNIENATVITAIPLDAERRDEIVRKISSATGKKIIAEFEVREEIIGGIIIETEHSGIDSSITSKLRNIERYISKN